MRSPSFRASILLPCALLMTGCGNSAFVAPRDPAPAAGTAEPAPAPLSAEVAHPANRTASPAAPTGAGAAAVVGGALVLGAEIAHVLDANADPTGAPGSRGAAHAHDADADDAGSTAQSDDGGGDDGGALAAVS